MKTPAITLSSLEIYIVRTLLQEGFIEMPKYTTPKDVLENEIWKYEFRLIDWKDTNESRERLKNIYEFLKWYEHTFNK